MARQIVDIGVEGNDGTGDAIRESFRKTNENFQELYAAFGIEGTLTFESLSDTPENYDDAENKVAVVNSTGDAIVFRELVSNGFLTDDADDDTVRFDFTSEGKIVVTTRNSKLVQDTSPVAGGPLNAAGFAIGNVGTDPADATAFVTKHGGTFEVQDMVPDIKYADENYTARGNPGEYVNTRDEPLDATEYTLTISSYSSGNAVVTGHGLTRASTGGAYTYTSTGAAATNLTSGNTYYIRRSNTNQILLYPSASDARSNTNKITASGGSGTQTLVNNNYDSDLMGYWMDTEALPRKSSVRRQGDRMDGPLYLEDHPGELEGVVGAGGLEDYKAATKYYVDQNSYFSPTNLFVTTQGDDIQDGTPIATQGRSNRASFRSINRACQKAEEIMMSAPIEPGPYMQTIVYDDATGNSLTTGVGIKSPVAGRDAVQNLISYNRDFIIEETIFYININYPNFTYDETLYRRDVGLILDAVVLDVLLGNNANYLSRAAGLRYYSNPSAQRAITEQATETLAAIAYVKTLVSDVLQNNAITTLQTGDGLITQTIDLGEVVDGTSLSAVAAKFDIITDIITDGPLEAPNVVDGSLYQLSFTNGGIGYVDQGAENQVDLLPGKIIRGRSSGALGIIVEYRREDDPTTSTPAGNDQLDVILTEPVEFEVGEELEYGNRVREEQISIRVESGIYYEDFPIKVPENVSIKGDEFRRVIVRPADRISQSRWANTYFYRDLEFDGLTGDSSSVTGIPDTNLPTAGVAYINPLTGEQDGWLGHHYLYDPTTDVNVSNFGNSNSGGYEDAAELLNRNRAFIAEEIVEYIDATYPALTYNKEVCRRDVGLIVDAIVSDLINGGRVQTLRAQGAYFYQTAAAVLAIQATETAAGINYIKTVAASVIANTAFGAKLGSVDQVIDTDFTAESGSDTQVNALVNLVAYAFDPSYNPPRHNRELDCFMMGDATIIRNLTVQGHGGFMMVLDPDGQVLTKSPYCQTGSSFAQSLNRQAFRGGMLVDAFCANIPVSVTSKTSAFQIDVESDADTGLYIRRPQVPAPFYIDGKRFQVNAVIDYDQASGTATFLLDKSSNEGNGFTGVTSLLPTGVDLDSLPVDITVQTAGNRSMLGNDFTQINDLGYGLVTINGGLSEMVSQFTYYCWTAYYSKNGSEIRSLNGSNAYGEYGLVAEGSDPNEIPDAVQLRDNMVMPFKTFKSEVTLKLTGTVSVVAGETLTQATSGATGDVVFDTDSNQIYLENTTGTFDTSNQITGSTSGALGAPSVPTSVSIDAYNNAITTVSVYAYDFDHNPQNTGEIDILHDSGTLSRYEVTNVGLVANRIVGGIIAPSYTGGLGSSAIFNVKKTVDNGYLVDLSSGGTGYVVSDVLSFLGTDLGGASPANDLTVTVTEVSDSGVILDYTSAGTVPTNTDTPNKDGQVYKLNFTTGDTSFADNGLTEATDGKIPGTYRHNQTFVFTDVANRERLTNRPSTAIVFDSEPDDTYRSIAFGVTESTGEDHVDGSLTVTFDVTYDYVRMIVSSSNAALSDVRGGGGTMGDSIGDTIIAIEPIAEDAEINRINSNSYIFGWDGKVHQLSNYVDRGTYATVEITDLEGSDIVNAASSSSGLITPVVLGGGQTVTLRAGQKAAVDATITVNISTCRATGHDFLDIGTGGFNTSNFPNVLLGSPRDPQQANEVEERNKGRVFYVSTDQDGFFRVGRFFTVDQGTGRVTFAASIALSNLDGIGFKRGVVVAEFSTDTAMSENATDIVPTQSAVRGYVNRRLGFDHSGDAVSNVIGSGVVAAVGGQLGGDLNAASNKITNLAAPSTDSDAATKAYVDGAIEDYDTFEELRNTYANTFAEGQIVVATGKKKIYVNNVANGPFTAGDNITNGSGGTGTLVEVENVASDIVYGTSVLLTYTVTAGSISDGDSISSGIKTADVISDPLDEITNADVPGTSDISISITRTSGTAEAELTIATGAIVNANVNASAAISQSKLSMNAATTRANATGISQVDLGLASFDSATFTATNGWIEIADGALEVAKIEDISNNRVLGNISGSSGPVTEVPVTTGSGVNSVVLTQGDGSIRVESLRLGGNNTYEILSLTGTQLNVKTPAQGVVFTASGATDPTASFTGNIEIDGIGASESVLHGNSLLTGNKGLGASWIYSSFIEAPQEKGAASTGIAIGANTGVTTTGQVAILVANTVGSTTLMPFKFDKTGVIPDVDNSYNIGSASFKYNTIYASTFSGNATTSTTATQADTLKVDGGSYRAAATAATANTVAARDASGNLTANVFNGVATSARYADLAEKYMADEAYEPGTVLVFGGENEVTVGHSKGDTKVAGVVSANPAHLMNSQLEGDTVVALALQGRVPTKVLGRIKKGDLMVTSPVKGYACVDNNAKSGTIIGKALENKDDDGYGIIEVVVGRV